MTLDEGEVALSTAIGWKEERELVRVCCYGILEEILQVKHSYLPSFMYEFPRECCSQYVVG